LNQAFGYAIFHCNLAFSSIEAHQRDLVIDRCYTPLLDLVETGRFFCGIEMSAFTLEEIFKRRPEFIERFSYCLKTGLCEMIASGDSQIIGPLVPYEVNLWNLELGQEAYERILHQRPEIAFVNEQAISAGLIDVYLDAGFQTLVVEWENLASHHPEWPNEYLFQPCRFRSLGGRTIQVLWNWCIAFQKLQRVCHDQLPPERYLDFMRETVQAKGLQGPVILPIYGNDAEVFDFRPGRFQEEQPIVEGEWATMAKLFEALRDLLDWKRPSQVLAYLNDSRPALDPFTSNHPISVKKQRKYNLTRWCLSGRNDLLLNTHCHKQYQDLISNQKMGDQPGLYAAPENQRRQLCRIWASDFRTHLTQKRYEQLSNRLLKESELHSAHYINDRAALDQHSSIQQDTAGHVVSISHGEVQLQLNLVRGGAIHRLQFGSRPPFLGTIEHGDRQHIALAADFYSNHTIVEQIADRKRITDLGPSTFRIFEDVGELVLEVKAPLPTFDLTKTYRIHPGGKIHCGFHFNHKFRPIGTVRLGFLTLLKPKIDRLVFSCHNGGPTRETYSLTSELDHGQAVSSLISSSGCLGATEGKLWIHDGDFGVAISWNPAHCAAIPMIQRKRLGDEQLNRFFFSLCELDETLASSGQLLDFEFTISPSDSWPEEKTR